MDNHIRLLSNWLMLIGGAKMGLEIPRFKCTYLVGPKILASLTLLAFLSCAGWLCKKILYFMESDTRDFHFNDGAPSRYL